MLALVDSGSTIDAAWIAAHFAKYAKWVIESKAQARGESATTPGGHQLLNEGRCRIEPAVGDNGFPVAFQNMRVDGRVVSVRKYVRGGWDFMFSDADGRSMTSRSNGKTFTSIEADDAFLITLKVKQPPSGPIKTNTGFTRPGNPYSTDGGFVLTPRLMMSGKSS